MAFLTNPYQEDAIAFTLDQKYFEFNSEYLNTYFQFDATVKTFAFIDNTLIETTIPQKIVLFKGYSRLNINPVIHRLMQKFNNVNTSMLQYQMAILSITCSEKYLLNETLIRTVTLPNVSFVAGLSRGVSNFGILNFNSLPNRGTTKGFAIINILYPAGNYELRTLKNGNVVSSIALPTSANKIVSFKMLFSKFNTGDTITYSVDLVGQTNITAPKKIYQIFPETIFSNMIVWEDEFLLQSAFEFTGTASIKSDFDFISQKEWFNEVESLNYLHSTKEVKITINTGWISKTDIDTIESVMRTKRAWLLNSNENISLRPIAKSMINEDLSRELIEFSIEFIINRNYNEETYSL